MEQYIYASLVIGSLAGLLVLFFGLWIRVSWIHSKGGESYYRGWKDALKEVDNALMFGSVREPKDWKERY